MKGDRMGTEPQRGFHGIYIIVSGMGVGRFFEPQRNGNKHLTVGPQGSTPRNTRRALRNLEAMEKRNICRSMERNIARRLRKITNSTGSIGAQAQELQPQAQRMIMARLNVRGMIEETDSKQLDIETWMRKHMTPAGDTNKTFI